MQRKVLIIGLDGGTWDVLNPAFKGGFMPCLSKLISDGTSGILESTLPAITPAAWGSFHTGCNPGKTGVFDFYYWDRKEKKIHYINAGSLPPSLWQIASGAGKRVGVINVPMTYPPAKVNGYVVSGFLTPSLDSEFTYPPQLKAELLRTVEGYHIFNLKNVAEKNVPSGERFELFLDQMADILRVRTEAAKFIIAKEPLDVFMVHFQASDIVQHVFWGSLDGGHESFSEDMRNKIFEKFYRVLDDKISEVMEAYGKTANGDFMTLVVSDHGFQTHHRRFNLGNWLVEQGYLKIDEKSFRKSVLKKYTKKLRLGRLCRFFMPKRSVDRIGKKLDDRREVFWDQSRAFSIGRSGEGFVYLLDDDMGQRDKIAAELTEQLERVVDPDTGSKVVQKIYRKAEVFSGDRLEHLPDIVIEPSAGYSFTGLYQAGKGLFQDVSPLTDMHIGKHHKDGIFITAGSGVKKGYRVDTKLVDMAAMVLYYLGIPVRSDMDGCVRKEIFTEEFLACNPEPEHTDSPASSNHKPSSGYTSEDEEKISERLEDLGYL